MSWYTGLVPEQYKRTPNTNCVICGNLLYRRPCELERSRGNAFCSSKCYGQACRKERSCVVCGKGILSNLHRKTCSRSCSNKNREGIKYKVNSPHDKAKSQQALKMQLLRLRGKNCERCGYGGFEILQVHHKDRNRNNNDTENLELVCPNCHCEEHYALNSWLKDFDKLEAERIAQRVL